MKIFSDIHLFEKEAIFDKLLNHLNDFDDNAVIINR